MGQLKYKGYTGSIEYSAEDECLYGKVLGLKNTLISYEGNSVEEIKTDFEESIDYYLESCSERGISPELPYNGRIVIKLPADLYESIKNYAVRKNISIDDVILQSVKDSILPC